MGKGGSVNITAESLSLTSGAQVSANTSGQGNAGNVTITARDTVSFVGVDSLVVGFSSGVASSVEKGAVGNGGSVNITAGALSLTSGAQVSASTSGQGNAGSVNINARDTVSFDGVGSNRLTSAALSQVGEEAVGNGGDISITTGSLSVTDGAQLLADTLAEGNAGSVNINARDTVSFDGVSRDGWVSAAFSGVGEGAVGNGGDINITTGSLSVTNGTQLLALTRGQGDAGSVNINARDTVSFDGVGSNGLISAAFSQVGEEAVGNGGDINITTGLLSVKNGAQLLANTLGEGNAGSVNINARDTVSFDGVGNGLNTEDEIVELSSAAFSQVGEEAVGNGGDINITTGLLSVKNGARLSTSSDGSGAAGNIEVAAGSIRLDNFAVIRSDTTGRQGNIILRSQDLVLRRGSNITTEATGTATGGNITIDTGVIAALENSDIRANAEEGSGGRVIINAQGIFGTEFRNQPTSASDITANSNLGPQFSGTVEINTSNVDLNQGLITLPVELVNVEGLIANSCIARSSKQGGNFNITGAGGLPTRPGDAAISPYPTGTVRSIPNSGGALSSSQTSSDSSTNEARRWKMGDPIVEPQGVYRLANGELVMSRECFH